MHQRKTCFFDINEELPEICILKLCENPADVVIAFIYIYKKKFNFFKEMLNLLQFLA